MIRRLSLGLAAAFVAAAGLTGGTVPLAPSASAAGCSGTTGVTVVVDYNELGGIQTGCDASSTGYAVQNFQDAGFPLERTIADPSFVCRVAGLPGKDVESCAKPASGSAYWSLWVSDGKSGTWAYSMRGVDSLRVPEGGYVAFSWHTGAGSQGTPPDVNPTPRTPKPTPKPTPTPSARPTKGATTPAKPPAAAPDAPVSNVSESPSATGSASPSSSPSPSASDVSTAAGATPGPTDPTSALPEIDDITAGPPAATEDTAHTDDTGITPWLLGGGAVLVLGGAAAVPILRSRAG